jgi:hypothetical protein
MATRSILTKISIPFRYAGTRFLNDVDCSFQLNGRVHCLTFSHAAPSLETILVIYSPLTQSAFNHQLHFPHHTPAPFSSASPLLPLPYPSLPCQNSTPDLPPPPPLILYCLPSKTMLTNRLSVSNILCSLLTSFSLFFVKGLFSFI